jgi:FHS family L-fucose permease-like MFS transporter
VSLVAGLVVTALGALLFIPAAALLSFPAFVGATFVLATGLCCVETASETYVNCLGDPEQATQRLNLAQAFSGLGTIVGPFLGGALFFSPLVTHALGGPHRSIQITYAVIALGVLVFAALLARARLPETTEIETDPNAAADLPLHQQRHFVLAVITQILYVSAQVSTGAFFINLAVETWPGFTSQNAAFLLSIAMVGYLAGRFLTTALMSRVAPRNVLILYATASVVLMLVVSMGLARISALALMGAFFFMAPMFGTIFGLGGAGLGRHTKRGFSILVTAIGGGILLVYPMGLIAERYGTARAYLLPTLCLAAVGLYAWKGARRPALAI